MGIRFACPNGHKLNVKAELAGKRAICPKCKTKLLIPTLEESTAQLNVTGQQEVVEQASPAKQPSAEPHATNDPPAPTTDSTLAETQPADLEQSIIIKTTESQASESQASEPQASAAAVPPAEITAPEPPVPPAVAQQPPPEQPATEVVWYVRSATGEQFGPAGSTAMREWIEQGRVAADSWTWRTGWEDWQPGTAAIAEINATNPTAPPVEPAAALGAAAITPVDSTTDATSGTSSAAEARRLAREKKKKRNKIITIVLAVLTLVLGGVLAAVLWPKSPEPVKPQTEPTKRVAPVEEPAEEEPAPEETDIEDAIDEEFEDLEEELEERSGASFSTVIPSR